MHDSKLHDEACEGGGAMDWPFNVNWESIAEKYGNLAPRVRAIAALMAALFRLKMMIGRAAEALTSDDGTRERRGAVRLAYTELNIERAAFGMTMRHVNDVLPHAVDLQTPAQNMMRAADDMLDLLRTELGGSAPPVGVDDVYVC